jgi:hypothetical protein
MKAGAKTGDVFKKIADQAEKATERIRQATEAVKQFKGVSSASDQRLNKRPA